MAGAVEIDYSKLRRDLKRFADGITGGVQHAAGDQAETTANSIDAKVPVRTGLLASTVASRYDVDARYGNGYVVTYGGTPALRYAGPIESRYRPVRRGCRGARTDFFRRLAALAATEAGKI